MDRFLFFPPLWCVYVGVGGDLLDGDGVHGERLLAEDRQIDGRHALGQVQLLGHGRVGGLVVLPAEGG